MPNARYDAILLEAEAGIGGASDATSFTAAGLLACYLLAADYQPEDPAPAFKLCKDWLMATVYEQKVANSTWSKIDWTQVAGFPSAEPSQRLQKSHSDVAWNEMLTVNSSPRFFSGADMARDGLWSMVHAHEYNADIASGREWHFARVNAWAGYLLRTTHPVAPEEFILNTLTACIIATNRPNGRINAHALQSVLSMDDLSPVAALLAASGSSIGIAAIRRYGEMPSGLQRDVRTTALISANAIPPDFNFTMPNAGLSASD